MRAVKCKNGTISLISNQEARIYKQIEFDKQLPLDSLSERELAIAEEMHKRNIIQKVNNKQNRPVYKTFSNMI